jgi:hypothetical protein
MPDEIQLASSPPDAGSAAIVDGTTVVNAKPRSEVIIGGPYGGPAFGKVGILLSRSIDQVVRQFGRQVYELMLYDSAVVCAFELLKAGILSDGLVLSPAIKMDPGEVISKRKRKADLKLASEICEAGIRSMNGLDEPVDVILDELLEACPFGCSLGEITYKWGTGEDKDRQMHDSIVPKPAWSWNFRVDAFMKVRAIRGWTGAGWQDYDPEKFAVLTWKKRHRDPRGQSGFRAAYNPWNLKIQQYPEFGEFLHHFADPTIFLTAGEYAKADYVVDPVTGKRTERSVIQQLLDALEGYKRRTGLALPHGSSAGVLSPGTEGGAYHNGFDRFDMEIFRSILFSSRAVQEAKHGSKADTDSSQDLTAMAFTRGRIPVLAMWRWQVLYRWVALNWSREVADRLTPIPSLGSPGHVQGELLNAYANAFVKGFVDEAQLPAIWDRLGLPPVDEAAMRARIEQRKAAQVAQAAVRKGEPVEGDGSSSDDQSDGSDDGTDNQTKPKGKTKRSGKANGG